ncbi:MAG TPA: YkgJ family cysteine cluster protein [Chitinophagaceae bacterium]|nr:YkgJ family cysteine cluster protein [Chitinophagaceae bacterium]
MNQRTPVTDLAFIGKKEIEKEKENQQFYDFLLFHDFEELESKVHALYLSVEAAVDCTACGNCCQSLMINVTSEEVDILAEAMQTTPSAIKEKYIEESQQGQLIMNTIPCHFLSGRKCSIYEHRFRECRDFPHLHKPGFLQRLPGTLMHYGRCPIIYNVVELLKEEYSYL